MRYQTSPYSPSSRPRGGAQQQHPASRPCPPSCLAAVLETLQALKWGGRSVGTRASSFEPARTLVASCSLEAGSAAGSTAASVGIHWLSQKHVASSTLLMCIHRPVGLGVCLQQLHIVALREHTARAHFRGTHTTFGDGGTLLQALRAYCERKRSETARAATA